MNLPNKLSLLRVALIPVMVALMLPQTLVCDLLAAAVFAVAALTDYFDGHIARSRHLITDFGKFIDPVADKLLNLSAMMMLVQRGTLPGWVVVLILARELAVDGPAHGRRGAGARDCRGQARQNQDRQPDGDAALRADYAPSPGPDRPRVGRLRARLSSARRGAGGSSIALTLWVRPASPSGAASTTSSATRTASRICDAFRSNQLTKS